MDVDEREEAEAAAQSATVMNLFRIDGRNALVTGGATGLGKVMAIALAQAGANVAIASRSLEACQAAAQHVAEGTGKRTMAIQADVTKVDDVERMAGEVLEQLGPIDILVNNAGVNIRGSIETLSEWDWDTVIDVNLKGPFLCCRKIGPLMADRGWGRIINLGSTLSYVAMPGRTPYCSAKAGLVSMTRVLALEWATRGVTVNSICPGPFATDMNKQILDDPEKYAAFVSKIPMGRWGELHELAGAAVFLASEASSYMTGASMVLDGGWTAQ